MVTKNVLNLLARHQADLKNVCPHSRLVFVCPICLRVFSEKEIDQLNTGHVWPACLRQKSEEARHQQVLLCIECNSRAGERGDAMMQEFEHVREGEETGKRAGLRRVSIGHPGRIWIDVQAYVEDQGGRNLRLRFPSRQNDRRKVEEARAILEGRGSVIIRPNKIFDWTRNSQYALTWPLIKVGWLTSAYLLAFHRLGYRYIFHSYLDPVRKYIVDSFDKKLDNGLDFSDQKDICVTIESGEYFDEPMLGLFVSTREMVPHHLEVSFLDHRVRLPFRHLIPPELIELALDHSKGLDSEVSGVCLDFPFHWGKLLGKPDYCLGNES